MGHIFNNDYSHAQITFFFKYGFISVKKTFLCSSLSLYATIINTFSDDTFDDVTGIDDDAIDDDAIDDDVFDVVLMLDMTLITTFPSASLLTNNF